MNQKPSEYTPIEVDKIIGKRAKPGNKIEYLIILQWEQQLR